MRREKEMVKQVREEGRVEEMLKVVDTLIILMKKFGKQLGQEPVLGFAKENYSDEMRVYEMLGGMRLKVKDCLRMRQYLYESLGEGALVAHTTDAGALTGLGVDQLVIVSGGEKTQPGLMISSPTKVYKRSLATDLKKLLGN